MPTGRTTATKIIQVRGEYVSARTILRNLANRGKRASPPIWEPEKRQSWHTTWPITRAAEVRFVDADGITQTIQIRNSDVRFFRNGLSAHGLDYLNNILLARTGDAGASERLNSLQNKLYEDLFARFHDPSLVETDDVVPYTTTNVNLTARDISDKGASLLRLAALGTSVPDICFMTAHAHSLSTVGRETAALQALINLERLSGRQFNNPEDPLLIAIRVAMPSYIPGLMPTYLNVGITEELLPALIGRYSDHAAYRMVVNGWGYILEALDPVAFASIEPRISPLMDTGTACKIAQELETLIKARDPRLLLDPHYQLLFFISEAYKFYDANEALIQTLSSGQDEAPTIIFQRMVCTVRPGSISGMLYSRNPLSGHGFLLEYGGEIFGDEIMTGTKTPRRSKSFDDPVEIEALFPGVSHFAPLLQKLERIWGTPLMVECHDDGSFTLFQLNEAELTGSAMVTAAMALLREGTIVPRDVLRLVKPYHLKQIEGPAIDRSSLETLPVFCRATSLLPRSALSGQVYFSAEAAVTAKGRGEQVILAKKEFQPRDANLMEAVDGILCETAAALHVTTSCRNRGIPGLVNLGNADVQIDTISKCIRRPDGQTIQEGTMVTISSRRQELLLGEARYIPARLLRFMDGGEVEFSNPVERVRFEALARDYRTFQAIARGIEHVSLKSFSQFLRSGAIAVAAKQDKDLPHRLANDAYVSHAQQWAEDLFNAQMGNDHKLHGEGFIQLAEENQARLLTDALGIARERKVSGLSAGNFILGSLVPYDTKGSFWQRFTPAEIAQLLNEWISHHCYALLLDEMGDRNVSRVRRRIETSGFAPIQWVAGDRPEWLRSYTFSSLLAARINWDELRKNLPPNCHTQLNELVDILTGIR